jgi:hypothetical protein
MSTEPVKAPLTGKALKKWYAYKCIEYALGVVATEAPGHIHSDLPALLDRFYPARHSGDYSQVRWYGRDFEFRPNQAQIVKKLWGAWEAGTPKMTRNRLFSGLDFETKVLKDVFKGHPAWGEMVRYDSERVWLEKPAEEMPELPFAV